MQTANRNHRAELQRRAAKRSTLVSTLARDAARLRGEHARQAALALQLGRGPGRFQAPPGFGLRNLPNPPSMAPTAPRDWHLTEAEMAKVLRKPVTLMTTPEAAHSLRVLDAREKRRRKAQRLHHASRVGGIGRV